MSTTERRYDIDWIRVIAIGLLLLYHVAIGFQPWGIMIQFVANSTPWESLWLPMTMLNIWRIPLLFFVSGMGVYFAIRNRNWKQLIQERAGRILVPFLFGIFLIVPIHVYIWQGYYEFGHAYSPGPGHLWFLGNIFAYVVILSPLFFYLKNNLNGKLAAFVRKVFGGPAGIVVTVAALVAEVLVLDPRPYEMYAMTWHGFFLGWLAFLFGFCFVLSGKPFWEMILRWRWAFVVTAAGLFILRAFYFRQAVPTYLLPVESVSWIISVFAFGYRYLNKPSKALTYLSEAAYPVYILHMIFLYLGSMLIFKLSIPVPVQFVLVLVFTVLGCFVAYEFIIRRINLLRPVFGLKRK